MKKEKLAIKIRKSLKISKWINAKLNESGMHEYSLFSIYSILIGSVVGFGAVAFHELINFIFDGLFHSKTFLQGNYLWIVILFPIIGMLIQSLMIFFFPEIASHKGVVDVIKAVSLRGGIIKFRTTLFHFLAPAINMGFGGSVGPESPASQIGGGIASKLGQFLGLSDIRRRIFTAAGSGAAIAAVFNTPLGGVFFAFEIILLHDFQSVTFAGLILASVSASAVSRIMLGNEAVFQFVQPNIGDYQEFYLYLILGIFGGLFSAAFVIYSDKISDFIKTKLLKRFPQFIVMAFAGLILGIAGFFFPGIFGIGYSTINNILSSNYTLQIVVILTILKFFLVPIILSSGGFGGIFAPSLFMGAGIGFIFATIFNNFFGFSLDYTTYILVGMGAILGGVNFIPISAILIIFEMSRDYTIIIPLMTAVISSTLTVQLIVKKAEHLKHLENSGYSVPQNNLSDILSAVPVKALLKKDFILLKANSSLQEIVNEYVENGNKSILMVNENMNVIGIVTDAELRPILTDYESVKDFFVGADVMNTNFSTLKPNDNLEHALQVFAKYEFDELPVVDNSSNKIIGVLNKQDLIKSYNQETIKKNLAGNIATEIKTISKTKWSAVTDSHSIVEIKIPKQFVGKSLGELSFRNVYNIEVLLIKQEQNIDSNNSTKENILFPSVDYHFLESDRILLFGENEKLEQTRNW